MLPSAQALTQPINGTYVGFTIGPSYIPPMENLLLPLESTIRGNDNVLSITAIYPSIGGNLGMQVGRRFNERYRLEAEFLTAYSTITKLTTIVSGTSSSSIHGYISTFGAFMVNAYVDLIPSKGDYHRASPYFGIGVGQAYVAVKAEAYDDDTFITNLLKVKQSTSVVQAVFGSSFFLDDYTSLGVEYRMQKYGEMEALGGGYTQHNINITMKFMLDDS